MGRGGKLVLGILIRKETDTRERPPSGGLFLRPANNRSAATAQGIRPACASGGTKLSGATLLKTGGAFGYRPPAPPFPCFFVILG